MNYRIFRRVPLPESVMIRISCVVWAALAPAIALAQQDAPLANTSDHEPAPVRTAELGTIEKVHVCGDLYLTGQFSADDLAALREAGIKRVINLRTDNEMEWPEQRAVEEAGMTYESIPFRDADSLTDEVFDRVRLLLGDENEKRAGTLLHCRSSSRVAAVWLPHRVLDEGVPLETAIEEARIAGLRGNELLDKARHYIRRMQMGGSDPGGDSTGEDDG